MRSRWSDDARLRLFFAAYFAAVGVLAPYLPLYLQWRGLSAFEIGVVLAMTQGMRVIGPNLWGYLADHGNRRLTVLRATALAACLAFAAILLPGGFGLVFAVLFAVNFFLTAQMPVAEAIVAAHLRHDGQAARRYGRVRIWGSIGFIVLVLAAGVLFDAAGLRLQPWLALLLLAVGAAAAFLVRDRQVAEPPHARVSVRARLAEPRVRWFFASAALMIFAHGAYYTYFSLYLAQLGYSKTAIGAFWVAGVLVEILFFYVQGRFFARFGAFTLLSASFIVAALRFFLIAEFADDWLLLLLAQLLHAVTFAVHHSASVLMVQQWFPGAAAARGQALYVSLGYGIGGTAGSLVAAWLWSSFGATAAFLSSSAAALAGWWAVQRARNAHEPAAAAAAAGSMRAVLIVIATLALAACQTVQTTRSGAVSVEREQKLSPLAPSAAQVDTAARQQYGQIKAEAAKKGLLNRDPAQTQRVKTIAERLIPQTQVFRDDARNWQWEMIVLSSPQVNAWCMPGGKMAVYTGLIDKLKVTDDELAAVIGHEIAHALREHARERMDRAAPVQLGAAVLGAVYGQGAGDLGAMFGQAMFVLPNSREGEQEADRIGVELAARAGYDPRAAVTLWTKMARQGSGGPPEILSTHPAPQTRIEDLKVYSERVMPLYEQAVKAKR